MNLKKKKKLQKDLMESKVTHFSKRKRGKTWVYGSMIVFTLLGTVLQSSGVLVQAMGQATPDSNTTQDVKAKSSDSEATPIVGEDKNLDNAKIIQQNSKKSKLQLSSANKSSRAFSNGTISVHLDNPYAFDAAGKSLEYLQKEHPGTNNPWLTFPLTNTGAVTEGNAPGRVYCLDEASPLNPGASATTSNTGSGSVGADWASLKPLQRAQLQWIGWLSFNNTKASAATDDAMYFAAQMIIWDIANGDGFPASAAASENHPANDYTQNLNGGHQSYQAIMDDMDYLIDQYNSSIKLPKFAQSEKTIILGQTAKFSDSNGVLHNYNKITATNGANATVSGNMLSVKPTKAGVSTITLDNGGISEDGPSANKGGVQVWFTNNTDGTPGQNVLYSANHPQANVKVKVNVIPAASIKITKKDSDSGKIIPGTKFILLNKEGKQVTKDADGKALPNGGEFTTGADGTVTINNLMADPENLAGGEAQTPATIRETYVPAPYTLSNNLVVVVNPDGTAKKPSTDLPIKVVPGTTASNPTGVTFSDKKQVQAIKVEKTNSLSGNTNITDNYSLAGATFEIKDKTKGTVVGNLVTDKNGLADMASSQYVELLNQMEVDDTYTIQEVQAPSGLAITWNDGKPKEFTLKYSGDDSQLVNPDTPQTDAVDIPVLGNVILQKVDSSTEDGKASGKQLLKDQEYTFFYAKDVKLDGKVIHKAGDTVQVSDGYDKQPITVKTGTLTESKELVVKTDGNGKIEVDNLPVGEYYAQETHATNDYTKNPKHYPFSITWGGSETTNTTVVDTETVTDTPQLQDISIQKAGKLNGTELLNDAYSLAGNIFEIKDVTRGTTVGTITTDAKGLATTVGSKLTAKMYVGDSYTVQEIKSGDGMALTWNDGKPQAFTLDYDEDAANQPILINPTIKDETGKNTNQEDLVDAALVKQDEDTKSDETQGNAQLQGAVYTLFYAHDIKDAKGKVLHKKGEAVGVKDGFKSLPIAVVNGKLVGEKYLSLQMADGVNKDAVKNLPITGDTGDKGYYWQEVKVTDDGKQTNGAPYGYTQDTTKHYVVSGQHDTDGKSNVNTIVSNLTVSDKVLRWSMEFDKVQDVNGSLVGLNGAKFKLTPVDKNTKDNHINDFGSNGESTSGSAEGFDGYMVNGMVVFKNIAIGNYYLDEVEAPNGLKKIDRILVQVKPDTSDQGAPESYTVTMTDTVTHQELFKATVKAADLTDGKNTMFKVNMGLFTDKQMHVDIKTKAHTEDKNQEINGPERGKETKMYDDVDLKGDVEKGQKLHAYLHRIVTDDKGKESDKIIKTLSFDVDDQAVKDKMAHIETTIDTTNDTDKVRYVWTEELRTKDDTLVIGDHKDLSNKDQTITNKKPTIKTKAHTKNNDQIIDKDEKGSKTEMYDVIDLTDASKDQMMHAYLHRVQPDDTGKVKEDKIIKTIDFKIDDATAKAQMKQVESEIDTSKDDDKTYYVWTEELNTPDDSSTIADHKDINNKDQTISYKPVTPTPHGTNNTPDSVIHLPETGTKNHNVIGLVGVLLTFALGLVGVLNRKSIAKYFKKK